MGTTQEKLYRLQQTKEHIRQSILMKGVSVPSELRFSEYPNKILQIAELTEKDYSIIYPENIILGTTAAKLFELNQTKQNIKDAIQTCMVDIDDNLSFFEYGNKILEIEKFDPSKLDYQAIWTCNGKTNTDTDKTIPNLIDPSNPFVLTNFLFNEFSGYDTYYQSMANFRLNVGSQFSFTLNNDKSVKYTALINLNSGIQPTYTDMNGYNGAEWKVLLTSNIPDFRLRFDFYNTQGSAVIQSFTINANEITTIPAINTDNFFDRSPNTRILTNMVPGDWFQLEEISSGNLGAKFDGVDDNFNITKQLPPLEEYTIVGEVSIPRNKRGGFGKPANWYWYGDQIYINATSVASANNVMNVIGFNSNGLIVKDYNSLNGIVGTLPSTSDIINNQGLRSKMVFKSLAIIPEVLNEKEIRSVYEYLQTLKATNIG